MDNIQCISLKSKLIVFYTDTLKYISIILSMSIRGKKELWMMLTDFKSYNDAVHFPHPRYDNGVKKRVYDPHGHHGNRVGY